MQHWFIEMILCDPMEQRERFCGVLLIPPFRILKGMMSALQCKECAISDGRETEVREKSKVTN